MSIHDDLQAVIDTSDHLVFGNNRNLTRREKHGAPQPDDNFNYGGDIRAASRWCGVLDCVSCQFMMIFKLSLTPLIT